MKECMMLGKKTFAVLLQLTLW